MSVDPIEHEIEKATSDWVVGCEQQLCAYKVVELKLMLRQTRALERIADALNDTDAYGLTGSASLANAIIVGLRNGA